MDGDGRRRGPRTPDFHPTRPRIDEPLRRSVLDVHHTDRIVDEEVTEVTAAVTPTRHLIVETRFSLV
ncbi:hypothetical protein GCM10018952_47070 [Streptosporangium vulgare]